MDAIQPCWSCTMEVVLQPPRVVEPGQILHPPLVVGIRVNQGSNIEVQSSTSQNLGGPEPNGANCPSAHPRLAPEGVNGQSEALWAFVHLIPRVSDSPESRAFVSQCPTLGLSGTLTDSPHRALDELCEDGMKYVKFQDLAIDAAGIFSLRVALCRMPSEGGHSNSTPGVATTIGYISSRDIAVHPSSPHYSLGM